MNRYVFYIIFILGLFTTSVIFAGGQKRKLALIIAIGDYPENTGWNKISSGNDVGILENALEKQGFTKNNITVLKDKDATKAGIIKQLKILSNKVRAGDVVLIHFSGHGQQINDDNADEPDGYDESIIPFDAHIRYTENYHGENHLRDDELNLALTKIREKAGKNGSVLVILDSCHSGTATRGFQKCRGTEIKFEPPGYSGVNNKKELFFEPDELKLNEEEISPIITYSASSPEQLNYEYTDDETGTSYGSLTFALCKALSKVDSSTTYRGLFDRVLVEMNKIAPNQNPQAEGDLNQKIFSGDIIPNTQYFKLKDKVEASVFTMNGGTLQGLYNGTEVGFYDIDTYDFLNATPKVRGVIVNSDAISSEVKVEGSLSFKELKNSWIYILNRSFGNNEFKIALLNNANPRIENIIKDILLKKTGIKIVTTNPDLVVEVNKNKFEESLNFYTKDDLIISSYDITGKNDYQIKKIIDDEITKSFQSNFLRGLELTNSSYDVSFEIVPVSLKRQNNGFVMDKKLPLDNFISPSNELTLKEGTAFKFIIENKGYEKAFYQIIDIQPDNKINILVPSPNKTPSDYVIYPGEKKELNEIFLIGKPYGKEMFKLIATDIPINLTYIAETRGSSKKENESPFEILFRNTYSTSRGASLMIEPSSVNIYSLPFIIIK